MPSPPFQEWNRVSSYLARRGNPVVRLSHSRIRKSDLGKKHSPLAPMLQGKGKAVTNDNFSSLRTFANLRTVTKAKFANERKFFSWNRCGNNSTDGFLSTVLENTGSVARDNLANERTFLAWSRSGLAFVGAGLGYFYVQTEDKEHLQHIPESNVLVVTGMLVSNGLVFLSFATYRYFYISHLLGQGKYPLLNRKGILSVIMCTGLTTLGSLLMIIDDRLHLEIMPRRRTTAKPKK